MYVCMYVCMSVCLSVCLYVYLFVGQQFHLVRHSSHLKVKGYVRLISYRLMGLPGAEIGLINELDQVQR